ncbi:MAG TPA: dihydrodipicolinate synthase family protein [Trueperaceae bacterium]|nr:dihydrodipicolinate synthase family protein [Trueperaceae bacterium]
MALDPAKAALLREGTVIPAHPLALDADRRLDERRQRALTRYYAAAGAGGVAVGVHTTQFAIRDAGLLEPVLRLAAETADAAVTDRPFLKVAGVLGDRDQALREAELAASLGYDVALLSLRGLDRLSETELVRHAEAVAAVMPVMGFYLQTAVGGRRLSHAFWRDLAELPGLVAIKVAPFDRYATLDVVRAVAASSRADDVALYTGNDDNIVVDLLTPFRVVVDGRVVEKRIVGGLLGQWAVWTRVAVELLEEVKRVRGQEGVPAELLTRAARWTDANAAVFDAANRFHGVIAGVHEVLRRQGLLEGVWCLDPEEGLSPGQAEEIERVYREHPDLTDDGFVKAHLREWLG